MIIYKVILPISPLMQQKSEISDISTIPIKEIKLTKTNDEQIIIDYEQYYKKYKLRLSRNEVYTCYTHVIIWNSFLKSNENWALVIDNSVEINTSFDKIKEMEEELPCDWDIFFPYDIDDPSLKRIKGEYMLGYKNGCSIYMISKMGASKLAKLNKFEHRLDDSLLYYAKLELINIYASPVDWINIKQIKNWEWSDRLNIIKKSILKQGQWTKDSINKIKNILRHISQAARDANIDIILCYGSLLGYIRHGGIMQWDDDVDIGIEEKNISRFVIELTKYSEIQFKETLLNDNHLIKIWDKDGDSISGYPYTFPFVDLWYYKENNKDIIFNNGDVYSQAFRSNLLKVKFMDADFKIPFNTLDILEELYPGWNKKITIYPWSHKFEQPLFYPYSYPINVNYKGKLITNNEPIQFF